MNRSPNDPNNDIDEYVDQVANHLKLRGAARQQALNDLRDALREAADAVDDAIAAAGRAEDYAASLDEQFGTSEGAFKTILGMPNSLGRGIGRRMASTFNPADERLFVPRIFGLGWAVNSGAVAVRLGWLRPDDVDDEILTDAADNHLGPAQVVAAAQIACAAAAAVWFWAERETAEAETGKPQTANLTGAVLAPVVSAVLLAASANREIPAGQRVTMPAIAAALAKLATGISIQYALRPKGHSIAAASTLAAAAMNLGLSYLPVRAALRRSWASTTAQEADPWLT